MKNRKVVTLGKGYSLSNDDDQVVVHGLEEGLDSKERERKIQSTLSGREW